MFHDVYVSEFTAKSRLLTVLYFSVKSWRLRAHRYEGRLSLFQMYQRGGRWGSQRGGKRGQKKNALQATILRITRGLWTVNSKSKPCLYFMKCSIPRVITNKQKICSLRVKKTRFRNCVCRFCFMLCSLPRVSTSKQKMCSPRAKKNAFSQLCLLTLVFV